MPSLTESYGKLECYLLQQVDCLTRAYRERDMSTTLTKPDLSSMQFDPGLIDSVHDRLETTSLYRFAICSSITSLHKRLVIHTNHIQMSFNSNHIKPPGGTRIAWQL